MRQNPTSSSADYPNKLTTCRKCKKPKEELLDINGKLALQAEKFQSADIQRFIKGEGGIYLRRQLQETEERHKKQLEDLRIQTSTTRYGRLHPKVTC